LSVVLAWRHASDEVAELMETSANRVLSAAGERERRSKRRFEIRQEVRYKMLYGYRIAETGSGRTINISSGGVWFTTESALTMGMPVELAINWPALLNDSCPMKLMIYGCVVRATDTDAVVAIERYEFRTQGSRSFQQQQQPAVSLVV
jgi:c-di-GMP-binding flagellar brake protein YcgR